MAWNFNTRNLARFFVSIFFFFLFINYAAGNQVTIFDLHKSLPLEPGEPVMHDYYINGGSDIGFRKGIFVNVIRKIPIHDPVQNKAAGILTVTIARMQLIHVEKNMSVGRIHSETQMDERPAVDFESVMIGDVLDTSSITSDAPASEKKRKKSGATAGGGSAHAAGESPKTPERHIENGDGDVVLAKVNEKNSQKSPDKAPDLQQIAPEKTSTATVTPGMVEQPIPKPDEVSAGKGKKGT